MVIATEFDGVIARYVDGELVAEEGMLATLKQLQSQKHIICLWTCREGKELNECIQFCEEHGLHFDYVQNSPLGGKKKIKAHVYVDSNSVATLQSLIALAYY